MYTIGLVALCDSRGALLLQKKNLKGACWSVAVCVMETKHNHDFKHSQRDFNTSCLKTVPKHFIVYKYNH